MQTLDVNIIYNCLHSRQTCKKKTRAFTKSDRHKRRKLTLSRPTSFPETGSRTRRRFGVLEWKKNYNTLRRRVGPSAKLTVTTTSLPPRTERRESAGRPLSEGYVFAAGTAARADRPPDVPCTPRAGFRETRNARFPRVPRPRFDLL